jgi:hypothetical protein
MATLLLIHGGLWEEGMDAGRFWHDPGIVAGLNRYFQTSIEFRPTLQAQHDDALAKNQASRAALFSSLITRTGQDQAS